MKTLKTRLAALFALATLSLSAVACDSIDPVAEAEAGVAPLVAADVIDAEDVALLVKDADEDARPAAEALLRAVELTDTDGTDDTDDDDVEPRSHMQLEMMEYCMNLGAGAYSGQCTDPSLQLVYNWCVVLDSGLLSFGMATPCTTL